MADSSRRIKKTSFWDSVKEVVTLLLIVFLIRTFGFGLYQVPTGSMETTMEVGERFVADKFTYLFTNPKRGDIISFNDPLYNYSENKIVRLFQEYVWGPCNWTKRVIGLPGETVKGVIENGKPVIYINGERLDEPYVNSYPLLPIYKTDPQQLKREAEKEALRFVAAGYLPASNVSEYINLWMEQAVEWRSYDPSKSYEEQPFYRMRADWVATNLSPKMPFEPVLPHAVEDDEQSLRAGDVNWSQSPDNFEITLGPDEYWVMGDNRRGSKDSRFIGALHKRYIHGRIVFRIWSLDSYESWWIVQLLKEPIGFWKRMRWSRCLQFIQ